MYVIATLYAFRQRLGLAASDTADDARLLAVLQAASAQIERAAGRHFCPRRATLEHSIGVNSAADRTELLLDDDLLELTALTNGDGSAINLSDVLLLPGVDASSSLLLLTGGNSFTYDESPQRAVSVSGIWGWHESWSQAWRASSDTVQNNPLGSSATTLTVVDADGLDSAGETPRFQVGHLIRIESEYLRVIGVNTVSNQLTVRRGVNGTTAVSHAQNTVIDVFQPAPDVAALNLRWAAWLYKEPDARPSEAPLALREELNALRRVSVKS